MSPYSEYGLINPQLIADQIGLPKSRRSQELNELCQVLAQLYGKDPELALMAGTISRLIADQLRAVPNQTSMRDPQGSANSINATRGEPSFFEPRELIPTNIPVTTDQPSPSERVQGRPVRTFDPRKLAELSGMGTNPASSTDPNRPVSTRKVEPIAPPVLTQLPEGSSVQSQITTSDEEVPGDGGDYQIPTSPMDPASKPESSSSLQIDQPSGDQQPAEGSIIDHAAVVAAEVEPHSRALVELLQPYFGDFSRHLTIGRADQDLFALLLLLNPRPVECKEVEISNKWTAQYDWFGITRSQVGTKRKSSQIQLKWEGAVNQSPAEILAARIIAATGLSEELIMAALEFYTAEKTFKIPVERTGKSQQQLQQIFDDHCKITGSLLQNFMEIQISDSELVLFRKHNQESPSAELVSRIVNFLKELNTNSQLPTPSSP